MARWYFFTPERRGIMKKMTMVLGLWICGLVMANGCATTERQGVTVIKEDQMPVWINDPRAGLEEAVIAGVGQDGNGDSDIETSKQAAELAASDKVAQELEKKIVSMFEKQVVRLRKGDKAKFSEKVNGSIKQLVAKKMIGVRYKEYYYVGADGKPNRVAPKTIFVRAVLDAENKELAEDLGTIEEEAAGDLFAIEEDLQVEGEE